MDKLFLVVGLGNPGRAYQRNRHNWGFRVADELARRMSLEFESKALALWGRGDRKGQPIVLMKPQTYVNRSGSAVEPAVASLGIPLDQLIVLHDDLDLPPGRIKLKRGGGSGGHKGVMSISQELDSAAFLRVRGGVGKPDLDRVDHVLGDFSEEEERGMPAFLATAADAVEMIVEKGMDRAMNFYNPWR